MLQRLRVWWWRRRNYWYMVGRMVVFSAPLPSGVTYQVEFGGDGSIGAILIDGKYLRYRGEYSDLPNGD